VHDPGGSIAHRKYVNARRWFVFVEHSIDQEPQWVVFEANGDPSGTA